MRARPLRQTHGPKPALRRGLGCAAVPAVALAGLVLAVRAAFDHGLLLQLHAPHTPLPNPPLSAAERRELDEALEREGRPEDLDAAVAFALRRTADELWFGLDHPTRREYGAPREGNCVEYAHFFAQAFERVAAASGLDASARPTRSAVTVLGFAVPLRGWADHDWVEVRSGDVVVAVDPTFFDYHLPWDVSGAVRR